MKNKVDLFLRIVGVAALCFVCIGAVDPRFTMYRLNKAIRDGFIDFTEGGTFSAKEHRLDGISTKALNGNMHVQRVDGANTSITLNPGTKVGPQAIFEEVLTGTLVTSGNSTYEFPLSDFVVDENGFKSVRAGAVGIHTGRDFTSGRKTAEWVEKRPDGYLKRPDLDTVRGRPQ